MLADGLFSVAFPMGFVILVFLTVTCLVGGLVDAFACFVGSLYILFLASVFSARALGAGFRSGVRPTVSTALTMGRTGRRFHGYIPYRMPVIFGPTALAFGLCYKQ